MISVSAKPRIGPVPKLSRSSAPMSEATCVSTMVHHAFGGRQLLLDAFEDQHVRVDAHADGQHESCEAWQGHRRTQVRHHAEQDEEVHHD